MPGDAILQRLDSASYDAFYQLASRYAENILSTTVSIYMGCDLLDTHLKRLGDAMFHDPAYRDALQQAAEANIAFTQNFTQEVRQFFWHDATAENEEKTAGYENRRNRGAWSPYDRAAWDRFIVQVVTHFKPKLDDLENRLKALDNIESLDQHPLDAEKAAKIKGIKHRLIDESLQRLHALLNVDTYEAHLQPQ